MSYDVLREGYDEVEWRRVQGGEVNISLDDVSDPSLEGD
jgi:hypothetical protein